MTSDGRQDQRQAISLKIRFKSATLSDFIEQNSADVSRGGMFVKMSAPMPVGTLIKFDLRLADGQSLVQGVGRVVWRREESTEGAPAGMGIKFIKLDETSRANLDAVISSKVEGSGGDRALPPSIVPVVGPPSKAPSPIAPVRPRTVPKKNANKTLLGTPSVAPSGSQAPRSPVDETDEDGEGRQTVEIDQVQASEESKGSRSERSTTPPSPHQGMPSESDWDEEDSDPHEMATVIASIPEMKALLGGDSKTNREDNTARVSIESSEQKDSSARRDDEDTARFELAKHGEKSSTEGEKNTADRDGKTETDGDKPPGAKNGLLEDISVAIDSALQEKQQKSAEGEDDTKRGGDEEEKKPKDGEKNEAEDDQEALKKRSVEEDFTQAQVDSAEPPSSKATVAIAVWVLLGLAGAAIWYFMFGPGSLTEEVVDHAFEAEAPAIDPVEELAAVDEEEPGATAEEASTTPVEAEPATTAIELSVKPADARIYLEGELQEGAAPLTLNIEPGREVEIRVSAWGYVSKTQKIKVTEEPAQLQIGLAEAPRHAIFKTQPRGAVIVVDGFRWGRTPNVVKRQGIPREFAYKISKAGYEELAGEVAADDWLEEDGIYQVVIEGELEESEVKEPAERWKPRPKKDKPEPSAEKDKPVAQKKVEPPKMASQPEEKAPEAPMKKPVSDEETAPKKDPAEKKIKPRAVEENPF